MRIQEKIDLRRRTTLRLGGTTRAELLLDDERDFDRLEQVLAGLSGNPVAWGGGSNILARDGEHDLVLIVQDGTRLPRVVKEKADGVIVRVGAGVRLARLLGWCRRMGLSGLEPLAGIPGTVGGAVTMNAGSFGIETADVLHRVRAWTRARGLFWTGPEGWRSGYRHFELLESSSIALIAEAEFILTRGVAEQIRENVKQTFLRKKGSQPVTSWTCGCVFKNPGGQQPAAGWLLDKAGFKGKVCGGVGFSEQHANFLVNCGGGTATAALDLIAEAREEVHSRFGVELKLEVKIYP